MSVAVAQRAIFDVKRHEVPAVFWSFAYFFCLLCSYYILRPVREEMGVQGGVENLQWLYTGTFVTILAAVPLFGAASARWPRARLIPAVYLFFSSHLLIFYFLMEAHVAPRATAAAFFIWLSVFNMMVVSVFWSFMADIYSNPQARRLYGLIAAGGSVGAVTGPLITATLVKMLGIPNLLLVAGVLLVLTVVCVQRLSAWAAHNGNVPEKQAEAGLGGSIWGGIGLTFSSRYLLGIAALILAVAVLNTFLYFEQARMVAAWSKSAEQRTQLFAQMDLAVNVIALICQAAVVQSLIARLGIPVLLAALMAASGVGYLALAAAPVLATLLVFQVLRRATDYSMLRPVREVLFTVVSREEKYKAKNFIDTVVLRGGDAASGWVSAGLKMLGAGTAAVALIAAPIAFLSAWLAWFLGREQEKLKSAERPDPGPASQATPLDAAAASSGR
ncbi:MAG: NTP/NDP exchange transporter [Terriglobales bacterium]